jgi:hypothetical protein
MTPERASSLNGGHRWNETNKRCQATAPLVDGAILFCGKAAQTQQGDTEPTPAHGRGAAHGVRELARRISRLASRTKN